MKEKPILPLLLSMALPMVLSMMVNSLYNIIDSYFVAKINENAMTALSLVFPVQNLITAVGVGFGIGINATIAYFLGAQKQEKADTSATLGVACSFLHGVLLTIGTIAIMPTFLSMFTKDQEVLSMGITYSRITFGFSIIISLGIAYEKIFQSVGRMKTTMFCMMSGCILNIILDPIMIFGLGPVPRMGIRGAAWATGLGQLLTLAAYLFFAWIRPLPVKISLKNLKFDRALLKKIYAVGIPATLNMALSSLLISSLNAILAAYGQMYVMILGVYYKLQTFLYLPANGIIQGMRPLIGYNYGAGEQKRVHKLYSYTLYLSAGIMLAGTLLCMIIPGTLLGLFTTNPQTIAAGSTALRIISLGFIVSSVSITSCGALEDLCLRRLVALLDNPYSLYKLFIARLFGHLAKLEHAAGFDVALTVAGQQAQNGVYEGFAGFVLGKALDITFYHCNAVLHSIAVAVYGIHSERKAQTAVAGSERMAALVIFGYAQNFGLHFQDGFKITEHRVLDRLNLLAQFAQYRYCCLYFLIDHRRITLALPLAFGGCRFLLSFCLERLIFLTFFHCHFYLFHLNSV